MLRQYYLYLVHIESPGYTSEKKYLVQKEQTNKINLSKNPLFNEKKEHVHKFLLAYYKIFIAESVIVSL